MHFELKGILEDGKTIKKRDCIKIKSMKDYIDRHIDEDISLAFLTEKFAISKYYLCHLFKNHTGYTVIQYIKHKRLLLVKQYYESGVKLIDAAMKAGFRNYSNFYKAYRKEFGTAPSMCVDVMVKERKQASPHSQNM